MDSFDKLLIVAWILVVLGFASGIFGLFYGYAYAADYPYLSSPTGEYMGEVSKDHWDRDSISNPIGRYGSRLSPDSVKNPLGRFGSEYSSESPYYIGRPGSLERPENRSRSRWRIRELRRELRYRE